MSTGGHGATNEASLIQAALTVAGKYPVLPLRSDKRPATVNGFKDATQDPDTVRRLFSNPGAALIGVPTGHVSGLFALDVDPDGAPWLHENRERLPVTRTQKTRRGGYHFLFRMPVIDVRCSAGKLAPGIDIRANGGYIVWWRAEGLEVENAESYAEVPEWLLNAADCRPLACGTLHGEGDALRNLRPRCNISAEQCERLGRFLDVDSYDGWVMYGAALHHELGDAGLPIWDRVSQLSDKYPGSEEVARKYASFGRYAGPPLTMRTVINAAKRNGAPREVWATERGLTAEDLDLRVGRQGPVPDEENVGRILERDPNLVGIVRWDEFRAERVVTRLIPGTDLTVVGERDLPRPWRDSDTVELQKYIQRNYMARIGRERIEGPLDAHARRHASFHPVRDYLHGLEWDRKPRLDMMLREYFAATAQSGQYLAAVGSKFLLSAVARVMEPGCQVDSAIVFEGPQGVGKSTAQRILFSDEWFSDSLPADLSHKDARDHLRGKWGVELAELAQFKRAEIETIKSFLSRRHESYRPSYGRHEVQFPRQCVFVGSTNASEYLVDQTGNRRFWIVVCGHVHLEGLAKHRNQLWAEAVHRYRQHEPWHLRGSVAEMAAREAQARVAHDPWTADVAAVLATMGAHPDAVSVQGSATPPDTVAPNEVLKRMQIATEARNDRVAARVGKILEQLGWKRGRKHRTRGQLFERPPATAT